MTSAFEAEQVMGLDQFNNYTVAARDTNLWRDDGGELVNLTSGSGANVVTHQCFENGSSWSQSTSAMEIRR